MDQHFDSNGVPYVVREVVWFENRWIAKADPELCAACGICTDFCAFGALSLEDGIVISWDKCMGCGVCVDQCQHGALLLVRDENKGMPLDVRALAA